MLVTCDVIKGISDEMEMPMLRTCDYGAGIARSPDPAKAVTIASVLSTGGWILEVAVPFLELSAL